MVSVHWHWSSLSSLRILSFLITNWILILWKNHKQTWISADLVHLKSIQAHSKAAWHLSVNPPDLHHSLQIWFSLYRRSSAQMRGSRKLNDVGVGGLMQSQKNVATEMTWRQEWGERETEIEHLLTPSGHFGNCSFHLRSRGFYVCNRTCEFYCPLLYTRHITATIARLATRWKQTRMKRWSLCSMRQRAVNVSQNIYKNHYIIW